MITFKSLLAPVLVASLSLGAVSPVLAQNPGQNHSAQHQTNAHKPAQSTVQNKGTKSRASAIRSEIYALDGKINRAAQRHTISKGKAASLKRDTTWIKQLYTKYSRDGISSSEARTLQAKVDRVEASLRSHRG